MDFEVLNEESNSVQLDKLPNRQPALRRANHLREVIISQWNEGNTDYTK